MPKRRPEPPSKHAAKDWRITRGGRKLGRIIERLGMTETEFARGAGVERITLHRVISGERWKRIDINFILAVCDFAKNGLTPEDFAAITAEPVEGDGESEDPAGKRRTGTEG